MPQRQQQHRPSPGGSNVQNSGGRRSRERERDRDRDRERDKSKDGVSHYTDTGSLVMFVWPV